MAVVVEREQRVQVVTVLPCAVQVGAVVDTEFECPRAGMVAVDKFVLHFVHLIALTPVAVQVAALVVVYVLLALCPVAGMGVVVVSEQRLQVATVLPWAVQVGVIVVTEYE